MAEQKIVYIHTDIAPNMLQIVGDEEFKLFKKLAIEQAQTDLQHKDTLQELGFTGKPDLANLKIEYPITFELQEDGSIKSCIPISVPCLNESD